MAHQRRTRVHSRAIPLSETIEAWLLVLSFIGAVWLMRSDAIAMLVALTGDFKELASFVAGFFYTSILTTAPAIIGLGELSFHIAPWKVAALGSAGAVSGELLMFRFIRSPLMEHMVEATFSPTARRLGRAATSGALWWIGPLLGAMVIASPLPDELGLLMLGLTHIRTMQFVPLAFVANFVGIYGITILAASI